MTPDFLLIGHVTRDLLPGGGWRLGGTVLYAAVTAQRLGLRRVAVVTSGPADVIGALRETVPDLTIECVDCDEATTFENIYTSEGRRQYLRGQASTLTPERVPEEWRAAPLVLLAPLAREVAAEMAAAFPGALVAATPQGWLRRWNTAGLVSPGPLDVADAVLPHLRALVLSREDVTGHGGSEGQSTSRERAEAQIVAWAQVVPVLVETRGPAGAILYRAGAAPESFAGYPAREVDPTGAGDVFTTAFLCHYAERGDARAATDFANRVAALSVEREGFGGIPTPDEVTQRFG